MKPVTVRAGNFVKFDVDVQGEPPPTITWHFDNSQLTETKDLKIVNEDYNTKFSLGNTTRKNTGKYIIKAKNVNGEDEASVEVTVLGKMQPYID